ncbi:hypothetical protein CEE45_11000 [Candidatus Heimdallarchaeota archaeon B3_Heim]|nr:MAG: hypothetical protein CEE45_11000 [Candidatus Heimdallarchaeota archaeon B3_Heim]
MKPITVYFPDKVLQQVDKVCEKWNIRRSEYVREAIVFYLEQSGRESFIHQDMDIIKRQLDIIVKKLLAGHE